MCSLSRPSSPYPANECCGMKMRGNDGHMYVSVENKNGVWVHKESKLLILLFTIKMLVVILLYTYSIYATTLISGLCYNIYQESKTVEKDETIEMVHL